WLPAVTRESAAAPADKAAVEPAHAGSLSVLAVDDDALVLASTVAMLEDLGHRAVAAPSAREALDMLRTMQKVDLVITDLVMPGITGLQLVSAIRSGWPDLPIVVATGYSHFATECDLPRLSKPFRQRDLARAIAVALQARDDAEKIVRLRARSSDALRSA